MIKRLESGPRMSQAVVHGSTVYLAGQVADDPSVDVAGQTTVEAKLAAPQYKVEIQVTAAV